MKKLLFAVMLAAPLPAMAQAPQAPPPRTLSINANATVERAPDQATLLLAVESEAGNAQQAATANATKMDRLMAALRQLNIPAAKIRTVSYQLQPQYAQDRGEQPRIASYRAMNQVQVVLDAVDRVGPTIDAALNAGANRIAGLSFGMKDPQSARLEALSKAVEKARAEAEVIARAAGQTLGEPLSISTDGYFPPPRPMMSYARAEMDMAAAVPTPVEGGTLEIGATVNIVFKLLP